MISAPLYMTVAAGTIKNTRKKEFNDKLSTAIARAVDMYKKRMKAFLRTAAANAYAYGSVPKDTGELLASGMRVIDRSWSRGTSFGVYFGFSAPYAAYINYGYPARTAFPPPYALEGWAIRHGMEAKDAFLIARAIYRRGLRGRHFFEPGVERAKVFFQEELRRALTQAFPGQFKVGIR